MKPFLFLLLTLPLALKAQEPRGGCSITLLSDSSTMAQAWCLAPPIATIEPVVFLVEGTGVQVPNLPVGLNAVLSNDTMTISGTLTSEGLNSLQVTTSEGCMSSWIYLDMSVIVDPEFACEVQGEDVILHWPGMNATLQALGEVILLCTAPNGFIDTQVLFLPCPDSLVWSGLPTKTELTFGMTGTGDPYCFPGYFETTCTIITAGVHDHAQRDMQVRAVPHGEWLELSASVALSEVRIYDMVGAQVLGRTVRASTASIPIPSLAPGAYVLRATGADGRVSVQRFVKQ